MKVYIVFMENGSIYSVHKSLANARKDKADLERRYENATIKTFDVQ